VENIRSWFTYVKDNQEFIIEEIINHAQIVLIVIAAATVTSVLLGAFIQRRPVLRAVVLALSGIVLTIPSLALFALFIPVVGIGNPPAMLALYLYAIMPVLRNTVTGLDSVSPAVVESAKGMGMSSTQQLLRVRLPLAWPVIMAGVRISSLMTVGIAAIAILVGGDGLGTYIQGGLTRYGLPNSENSVWTGVIFAVLLGLVLDIVFATFQRLTTPRGLRA
jgi:osmoprotectant transport system permease protein